MNKLMFAVVASFFLSAPAALASDATRIHTNVKFFEFNSVASEYMARPTFANIKDYGLKDKILVFEADGYGGRMMEFSVSKEFVDENIEVINKYLKWEETAKSRGDLIDKEIATVRGWDMGPAYSRNHYLFHSGNKDSHYLEVTKGFKSIFGGFDKRAGLIPVTLDAVNARIIIKELIRYRDGNISTPELDAYK
jgi:hypothetical protein